MEHGAVVREASDDGGVPPPHPPRHAVSCQLVSRQRHEPGLELRPGERSATHFRFTYHEIRVLADASLQRLSAPPYVRDVFSEHPEHRYLSSSGLGIAIQRERRLQGGQRELVGPHCAGEGVGAAGVDRRRPSEQDAGLRPAQQLVAREHHRVDAAGERLTHRRLAREPPRREIEQQAAAEIEQARGPPVPPPPPPPTLHPPARPPRGLPRRYPRREAPELEVRAI